MQEWQDLKMKRVQKGVLMVRSAFEHCVEAELEKAGFGKARIIKYSGVGICVITLFLLMFYFAMDSANAFGGPPDLLYCVYTEVGWQQVQWLLWFHQPYQQLLLCS